MDVKELWKTLLHILTRNRLLWPKYAFSPLFWLFRLFTSKWNVNCFFHTRNISHVLTGFYSKSYSSGLIRDLVIIISNENHWINFLFNIIQIFKWINKSLNIFGKFSQVGKPSFGSSFFACVCLTFPLLSYKTGKKVKKCWKSILQPANEVCSTHMLVEICDKGRLKVFI